MEGRRIKVRINGILTKSRNPNEYRIRLENQAGVVSHVLPYDPYRLIKFPQFRIQKEVEVGKRIFKKKPRALEWYIHKDDMSVI